MQTCVITLVCFRFRPEVALVNCPEAEGREGSMGLILNFVVFRVLPPGFGLYLRGAGYLLLDCQ